ncbi:MAG TPA: hypothetical protein VME45_00295 [Stellaceae bacterium]|nr:hypothetical protein [Stellaceae bacterium]
MDRIELLKARLILYRRYLSEGVDGDLARAYLWLIRKDEFEIATIAKSRKEEADTKGAGSERPEQPPDDRGSDVL